MKLKQDSHLVAAAAFRQIWTDTKLNFTEAKMKHEGSKSFLFLQFYLPVICYSTIPSAVIQVKKTFTTM